jgi:hypothetical protein
MAQVLLISEKYLKDTTYIDENVDVKLLRNVIADTQEYKIHQILGTALFNEVKSQIELSTLTVLNTTLLNTYIAPSLKYWTLSEGALIFNYKIMNKAIMKRSGENAEVVQINELDRLMGYFKERAEFFSERVTKYLIENKLSYPLYCNAGNGYDTIHPNSDNFTQGIYLG